MIVETEEPTPDVCDLEPVSYADVPEELKPLMDHGQEVIFAERRQQNDYTALLKQVLRRQVADDLGRAYAAVSAYIGFDWQHLDKKLDHVVNVKAEGLCEVRLAYRWLEADDVRRNGCWRLLAWDTNNIAPLVPQNIFAVVVEDSRKTWILAHSIEEALFLAREAHVRRAILMSCEERMAEQHAANEERLRSVTPGEALLAAIDAYFLYRCPS